jgi:hypothetical protein
MRISKAELESEIKRNAVLSYMVEHNIKLTRSNYIRIAWMGEPPEPLGVEEEAELPSFLQDWRHKHAD